MVDQSWRCLCAFEEGHKEDALRLLSQMQQPDQILIHFAALHGWHDLCEQLVEKYNLSPSDEADIFTGVYRPLHLACMVGSVELVKYLLTLPSVLLTVNEHDIGVDGGWSALERACVSEHLSLIEVLLSEPSIHMPNKLHSDSYAVLSLLSRRMIWSTEFPVTSYFPVFMTGNTATGKTTLTKAMVQLTQNSHSRRDSKMVSGVKTLTAGICPSQCSG